MRVLTDMALWRIAEALEDASEDLEGFLHTSPYEYINVDSDEGLFGSFLFFIAGERDRPQAAYSMSGASKYVHYMEMDPDEIVDASHLAYEDDYDLIKPFVTEIEERFEVGEDDALDLLCDNQSTLSEYSNLLDGDDHWWLQYMTARAARALGYKGVGVEDEQGAACMIDMLGWESDAIYEF